MTHPATPPGDEAHPGFGAPPGVWPDPPAMPAPPAEPTQAEPVHQYPQAQYSQAQYSQAQYPQAQYPGTTWPGATPSPPKRSLLWLWITLAVVIVLGLFAAGAVGAVLLARDAGGLGSPGSGAAPAPQATGEPNEPSTEPTGEPSDDEAIAMPVTVGGLGRSTNPAFENLDDLLTAQLDGMLPTTTALGAAVYEDPDSPLKAVIVMRMDVDVMRASDEALDAAFDGMTRNGSKVSGIRAIKPPAPLTGPAKCGNLTSQGMGMAVCVAADGHTVGIAMFMGRKSSEVGPLFNKIRLDLVP